MKTFLKGSFFLKVVLLWFAARAPAGAVQTSVITVCPAGCDHATVQGAVNAAATGDTVQILMTTPLTEADIVVNKEVTIEGLGRAETIVQAANTPGTADARTFTILAGHTVTMRDLTVRHGRVPPNANGGGIWVRAGGELTLENVDVLLNEASRGGGIANEGTLTITGGSVNQNTANRGGGLYAAAGSLSLRDVVIAENRAPWGGGMYAESGAIDGVRLFIRGNRAEGACGGGIAVFQQATLTLAESAFVFNVALNGGGICQDSADGAVYLTNVTLAANDANRSGGGIFAENGLMWLANVTVTSNSASDELPGLYDGGGIYITGGEVHLRSAIVALNLNGSGYPDCHGTFTTATFSLIGDRGQSDPLCGWSGFSAGMLVDVDPLMGIIPVTGYDTVRSLEEDSPAIDAGLCLSATGPAPATDQRGYIMPWDGDGDGDAACDMGAYEYGSQPADRLLLPFVAR